MNIFNLSDRGFWRTIETRKDGNDEFYYTAIVMHDETGIEASASHYDPQEAYDIAKNYVEEKLREATTLKQASEKAFKAEDLGCDVIPSGVDPAASTSYTDRYPEGYKEGYKNAYGDGHTEGYREGWNSAMEFITSIAKGQHISDTTRPVVAQHKSHDQY